MTWVLWLAVLVCVVQCLPMSQDELEDFSNFLLKTSSLDIHVKTGANPDGSYDEDEVVSDHAWEESGKFEGDLILNDRQRRLIVENVEGLSRNGLTDNTKRWPNNEVIYFIQKEHFTGGQVQAIQDGIDDLARASCVKFRPYKKGDRDAVVIQGSRRGCFSQVGYQGGYQVLNLSGRHPVGRGCFRHGTVVHELLHSLGFYHMQSSPDRDDYIDVIWSNIVQPARHNFRKYNSFSVSDFGVGYDYDSVLHYSRRAFSANGQDTLVPKKSGAEIGQRVGLSDKDTQKLNKMYCDADNDPIQAEENTTKKPKNKKKKPKNQPFQGHGIGYHQGKTVVIELPAAQIHKLPIVPSTHVFDFSKTPEVVPPEDGGYRFGKEVTYLYKPILVLNDETIKDYQNSHDFKLAPKISGLKPHEDSKEKAISLKEENNKRTSVQHFNDKNEVKPEYVPIDKYDKDLKDAFHRLTKIVKQHVYPQNQGYVHKVNKDYSKFYFPLQSQQFNPSQDSLDETLEHPKSYDQTLTFQKQTETKPFNVTIDRKSEHNFQNSQMEERMDALYGVSLPIKNPYSSNQQTETPYYANLEYLNNRHDYSNLYSPESYISNKYKSEGKSGKYEHDIKINPHDQIFYTDFVKEGSKGHISKDVQLKESISNKFKPINYELAEIAITMQTDPTKKEVEDRMDSSYKLLLPTKKPFSAYEQTHTPKYATLEYLKDRHNFSNHYTPKISDDSKQKEPYTLLGVELPPIESDWYKKDTHKHNPANYDQDLYSDYVQDRNEYRKGDTKDLEINAFRYNHNETSRKSPDKTQDKHRTGNNDQKFYTDYDVKENQGRLINKQTKDNEEKYAHSYYTAPGKNGNDYSKYYDSYEEDESDKDEPNKHQHKQEPVKYNHNNYYTDYEKEHIGRLVEGSSDNDDKNSKESPKKSQAYTLYNAPVPLTKNWYKPSYIIPETPNEDENSR